MRKTTFKKIYVMVAALLFTIGALAQEYPQAGMLWLPQTVTPDMEMSLILDVTASCPDSSLFEVDSVMMHSGVTIGDNAWQAVVNFDAMGANGQKPKLIPFSPGAQVFNLMDPFSTTPLTAWDTVTVIVWPQWSCPAGGLDNADSVMMHSGVTIDGNAWQNVVPFDGVGADGQRPKMTKINYMGKDAWIFTYVPADFYGIEEGANVTAINCVFNAGDWSAGEGKDIGPDGKCMDFRLQLAGGMPYRYSITLVPNDFYPIESGQIISAINCVFNGGAWDGHEGKAHKPDSDECEDFLVPLSAAGIFTNNATHNFTLHPNPVDNILNIGNLENVSQIDIYDITGKKLMTEKVDGPKVTFNVSNLTSGLYIVSYHTSKGILTSKFIKN